MECSIVESRNCERFAKERDLCRTRECMCARESVRCGDESGDWGGDKRVATLGDMQKIKRWLLIWPLVMGPCPLDLLGETPSTSLAKPPHPPHRHPPSRAPQWLWSTSFQNDRPESTSTHPCIAKDG